jgi:hypothetical protein
MFWESSKIMPANTLYFANFSLNGFSILPEEETGISGKLCLKNITCTCMLLLRLPVKILKRRRNTSSVWPSRLVSKAYRTN